MNTILNLLQRMDTPRTTVTKGTGIIRLYSDTDGQIIEVSLEEVV